MSEGFLGSIALRKRIRAPQQTYEYNRHGRANDNKIGLKLLAFEYGADISDKQEIVKAEIYAEEY